MFDLIVREDDSIVGPGLDALFGMFMDAYDHVLDRGRRAPRMKRPGNGDPIGLMKFEEHVRETIEAGLRDYLTRGRHEHR